MSNFSDSRVSRRSMMAGLAAAPVALQMLATRAGHIGCWNG